MTIAFNLIPANIRTPGVYVEIDNTKALRGLPQFLTRILVIGSRLSTGTISAGTLKLVSSVEEAKTFFGKGSQIANMFKALKANNKYIETWAIGLDDDGSGVAAAGTIVASGTATEDGTISLYVAGERLSVAVASGDVSTVVAAAVNAAINAAVDLPVTSSVSSSTVTVTARNKGVFGNDIDMRLNYLGNAGGEKTPAGVTLTLTQLASGATNPSVATAITALPDEIFDYWVVGYNDTTNIGLLETELTDRWGPLRMLEGHCFIAKDDTLANQSTFGNARNNPHFTSLGYYNSPTPPWEAASAICAQVGYAATLDPARPFGTLELVGVKPPPEADRFNIEERNTLYYDGISNIVVNRDNRVLIDRVITMYQTNPSGAQDPSYFSANTLFTLAYLRQDLRSFLSSMFERCKISDDGTRFKPGQPITTPSRIKAAIVGRFKLWEDQGLVEDIDQFKREIIVQRNASDPNRVDIQMPPNLINQLEVLAAQFQFLL